MSRRKPSADAPEPASPIEAAAPVTDPTASEATGSLAAIAVRSASDRGRWRAGLQFGPEPRVLLLSDLTESQVEALRGDPQLAIVAA